MNKEIFRILDANLNRSREGLRVCEDIARFILNSPSLTKELKLIRHRISDVVKDVTKDSKALFASRNSINDIGRSSKSLGEMDRRDVGDIFAANIERVKESLRVLEEFFKLMNARTSAKLAALRFRVYDIEKKSVKKIESLRNFR